MKQNLRFGIFLSLPTVLKISAILLKHPTFDDGFFMFSLVKQIQNLRFCTFIVLIKKFIDTKVIKLLF